MFNYKLAVLLLAILTVAWARRSDNHGPPHRAVRGVKEWEFGNTEHVNERIARHVQGDAHGPRPDPVDVKPFEFSDRSSNNGPHGK
ncbi:hypothetical protein M3Y99_01274600 [Aphelenchoides fujianensis]|nr:hypothetical protein M3Y99_01274600 [Aphelenchoides fujianensis]